MAKAFQDAVELNKSMPSPLLEIPLKLAHVGDVAHCAQVTARLAELCPHGWEVLEIKDGRATAAGLPREPGVYMFVWHPTLELRLAAGGATRFKYVLYVGVAGKPGSANTIRARYEGEYMKYIDGDPEQLWSDAPCELRADRLARYLTLRPLEIWYLCLSEVSDLLRLESRLMALFNPPINKQGRGRVRPTGKSRAF